MSVYMKLNVSEDEKGGESRMITCSSNFLPLLKKNTNKKKQTEQDHRIMQGLKLYSNEVTVLLIERLHLCSHFLYLSDGFAFANFTCVQCDRSLTLPRPHFSLNG